MSGILSLIVNYDFIMRAFVVGLLISICASLLGVSVVLRKLSMIGDGLSHISFGAIAVGTALGLAPLTLAVPVAIVFSIVLFGMGNKKTNGDSGIAVISTAALAVGIIVLSWRGSGIDLNSYLIGSLYSVTKADLVFSACLCAFVCLVFVLLYSRIFSVTFDEDFSLVSGVKGNFYNAVSASLTAVTVVIGMRLMGALLISALIVFPALSAMKVFKTFRMVTVFSVVFCTVSFVAGFFMTLVLDSIPTGACITLANLVIFLVMSVIAKNK